jgi:hypothetical protein
LALCAVLAAVSHQPAAAQWAIGLGFNIAETDTNAIGLGSTVTWSPASWFALRGFLDAELGIPDFKTGLRYDEPGREYIENGSDVFQNPKGDDLWQSQGWDMHAASYATVRVWLISAGPGLAYNGHDGSGTSGFAFTLVGDLTNRTELDIEFLQGGSWRMRVAVFFWQF